jgi:hypothetical protein
MRASRRPAFLAAILSALPVIGVLGVMAAGCGPGVDVTRAIEVQDVSTGWYDFGIVGGQNKLVPSVAFTLKNVSSEPVTTLQANVLFHRVDSAEEWGSAFLKVAGSAGLAPGATSEPLTVRSDLGYTGSEPRADMLKNAQFVDARVRILAKSGSNYWQQLGEYQIERRILVP